MTIHKEIKYNTKNENIVDILIDEKINIIIPNNGLLFAYQNDGKKNRVIVVEFNFKDRVVSQAFYQCNNKFSGTWLPFDGIKAEVNESNKFYTFFDTEAFRDEHAPFGNKQLMAVSYIIGGGVWQIKDRKYRDILDVEERISYLDILDSKVVKFEDSLYINHYINYAVSSNYLKDKKIKWLDGEELDSAFRFSYKMNNSHQIEYTPKTIQGASSKDAYQTLYDKIDQSEVEITEQSSYNCCIL